MPLKHLRICDRCKTIRFAMCAIACKIPADTDPDSWRENLQDGAGTMPGANP